MIFADLNSETSSNIRSELRIKQLCLIITSINSYQKQCVQLQYSYRDAAIRRKYYSLRSVLSYNLLSETKSSYHAINMTRQPKALFRAQYLVLGVLSYKQNFIMLGGECMKIIKDATASVKDFAECNKSVVYAAGKGCVDRQLPCGKNTR